MPTLALSYERGNPVGSINPNVHASQDPAWGAEFGVEGCGVQGSGFRVLGLGFGDWGLGFWVQGLRLSVWS